MQNFDYLYDKSYFKNASGIEHKISKELSYRSMEDAYILPYKNIEGKIGGGVVDSNLEFDERTSIHNKLGIMYEFDRESVVCRDEKVIYLGMFHKIWGHCISDNLQRLWFLMTDTYKQHFRGYKLLYIPYEGFRFSDNFTQLLEKLGIDVSTFSPVEELYRYSGVIIPDECFFTPDGDVRYFTREYQDMIEKIKASADISNHVKASKLYFTHRTSSKSKAIGEKYLEEFFKARGYKIIAAERYSFEEQLYMLQNCSEFAATVGSVSHNSIFLAKGAKVLLIPRANYLTGYQLALDQLTDAEIFYISADLSAYSNAKEPWAGPFYYYISDCLLDYFKIKGEERRYYQKKRYRYFSLYRLLSLKLNADNVNPAPYYQKLLPPLALPGSFERFLVGRKVIEPLVYILNKLRII